MSNRAHPVLVAVALLFCALFSILTLPLSLWRAFWTEVRR